MDNPANWTPADAAHFGAAVAQSARTPQDKRPLYREPPSAHAFPVEALGPLQEPVRAIQETTQAPITIVAQSVLAAATLATQGHRDVTLPGPGRRPLAAIFITIAESGERKSTVDRLALQGVADVEDYRKREYVAAMAAYQNSKKAWDVARRHAERNYGDDRKKLEAELNAIGPEPKKPEHPMMLVGDPTPEGLIMHLEGTPVAGIFTDEGGSLIGGVSFNDECWFPRGTEPVFPPRSEPLLSMVF
ncbi:MAG: DUF3987 domain-containing protein [Proteobacteria bacterium]|nr:DUF3987 domain-containing protein [Pseudomonadota bacterium]